ncbi:MAG TPA: ABC transporter ATP-binding protein [Gemmatimonadaceae bacterium]
MIEFRNVAVRYARSANRALDGVSFTANEAQVTAVAGPNGSGKSTLVRALLRRQQMEQGEIVIEGSSILALSQQEVARSIAVVSQREDLTFPMRVSEYVALGRYPRLGLWRSASSPDHDAVDRAMARAEVTVFRDRNTDTLSGGEWQRVRIARALAQEARALVLDEPTTFLDLAHEMSLFELVHSLAQDGMAILLVSHQLNLVARFAKSVVLLHHGRVAAAGRPDEVMQAPLLEKIYEWPVVVSRDPAVGSPSLVPLRRHSISQ